jgi:hypothetical protein
MPGTEAAAGGAALIKTYGVHAIVGAVAAGLGFAVLWPKTKGEGISRITVSMGSSVMFGSTAVQWVFDHQWLPTTKPNEYMIVGVVGLFAWWVLGAALRWFDKRKNKDIVEVLKDAKDAL